MPVFLCTHVRTHAHYMCKNDMHTRTHTILHTVTITLTPHASKDVLYDGTENQLRKNCLEQIKFKGESRSIWTIRSLNPSVQVPHTHTCSTYHYRYYRFPTTHMDGGRNDQKRWTNCSSFWATGQVDIQVILCAVCVHTYGLPYPVTFSPKFLTRQ